ncbi:NAD(P)-binding protein [Pseudoclavibacter chungangensis]|uniref:NAD(P)-binding protein n=1 Tax=Pseudoclavibacter chungangensis TaxID=587635 RepID=A0A7J5BQ07_9MICO|nr:FAD-dependent oxidoreductase [Pseudoclavibacter chungangensis]KAB1654553.1 NAD(P)-binding protein [Pseudoclavibacter chungangensis]NYJ68214.1 oxygen-dependent protoporphyrinogen oxidase [Pseudoclavibacter chungangensis]
MSGSDGGRLADSGASRGGDGSDRGVRSGADRDDRRVGEDVHASDDDVATGPELIVVGGGMAGLVAARRAALDGLRVTLLDAGDVTGGMLRAGRLGDTVIDIGAEAFATRGGAVERLLDELGLADDVVEPRRLGSWAHADGDAYRLPLAGLLGVPADPSSPEVLDALGADGARAAAADATLDAAVGLDATSLAELVRARMGDAVVARLVTPVARGVYSLDADVLDHRALAPGLGAALAETGTLAAAVQTVRAAAPPGAAIRGVRGGMHRVVRALDAELARLGVDVRTDARVDDIVATDDGWRVRLADGAELQAPRLLLTVPELAARVLDGTDDGDATAASRGAIADGDDAPSSPSAGAGVPLEEVDAIPPRRRDSTVPAEVVALLVRAPQLDAAPRGTGVLVGEPAGDVRAKALTHVSAKWPWLAASLPAGVHVLRLSYGPDEGSCVPRTRGLDVDELRALAVADASTLLGVELAADDVLALDRHEWRIPEPAARIGRGARLDELRAAATATPGLDIAGTWIDGTGLASVVPAAEHAARRLASTQSD